MLIILEEESHEICYATEQMCERQKILAVRLEKMWILQKEERRKFHEQMFRCHDVPCEQRWTHSIFWSVEELECFKHALQ